MKNCAAKSDGLTTSRFLSLLWTDEVLNHNYWESEGL